MKRAFGDTHFFLALLNPRDCDHARAIAAGRAWTGIIVTTRWVLAEIADGFSSPPLRALAVDFLRMSDENPFLKVVAATEEQFQRGFGLYCDRPDKAWSLTDCISFVVMEEEGLREALTGDRHFSQAGFVALLAEQDDRS